TALAGTRSMPYVPMLPAASSTWSQTSSIAPASRYMSSRSNGVTNVRFSRSTTSWVRWSPSCSRSLISLIRPPSSAGNRLSSSTSRREISTVFAEARPYRSKNSRFCGVSRRRAIGPRSYIRSGRTAASGTLATFGRVGAEPARTVRTPRFANDAERECARLLDFYGVPWEYEPRTFALEEDQEGRVTEAFTPDFYLPEQDLFVEVTVMKQALVTRKNRKLRKLRKRYPNVRIKLFYRRDIERLAQRFRLDFAR